MDDSGLPPFTVTPAAIEQIATLGGAMLVDIEPGGCSGTTYRFEAGDPAADGPATLSFGCDGAWLHVTDRASAVLTGATGVTWARSCPPGRRRPVTVPTMTPAPTAFPTVVFLGDSITTGWRGISTPRARWTSRVSAELGWREVNLAIDGMGFFRRRGPRPSPQATWSDSAEDTILLDAAIRLHPSAVVLSLGANDSMLLDEHEEEIFAGMDRDLSRLREDLPGTPVLVAPYFAWSSLPPKAGQIIDQLRRTSDRCGHRFTDALLTPLEAGPAFLCEDGMHPNDEGHRRLAASILPELRSLDLG